MTLLILFFLVLLYIGFPGAGRPLVFALFAIFHLYAALFWFLLQTPLRIIRACFRFAQRHTQQP